jgi:hypothetical protein
MISSATIQRRGSTPKQRTIVSSAKAVNSQTGAAIQPVVTGLFRFNRVRGIGKIYHGRKRISSWWNYARSIVVISFKR